MPRTLKNWPSCHSLSHAVKSGLSAQTIDVAVRWASLKRHVNDRQGQVARHIGSTDKAARLLGWRSQIPFADGLERTIRWYRENPEWWQAVLASEQTAQAV